MNSTDLIFNSTQPDPFYVTIRELHYVYEYLLAAISFSLNGCVVYLALTTKNTTMKNYCWVLLLSVAGDMVYTVLNFVTMMIVEVRAGKMWFITTGPFIHSEYPYNMLMSSLYLTGMYCTIMTIMVQFLYRYEALCKKDCSIRKFFKLYALGMIWSVVQAFLTWPCFDPPSEEDTITLKTHPLYTFDTPTYVSGDVKSLATMIHFTSSQLVIILLYVVVVVTGRRIHKALNCGEFRMSKSTRDAQRKLNMVMMLQAIYPGIIVGTPVFIGCAMAQFKLDVLWSGLYFVTSISCIPIANSLTVLLVIPSFRKRIFGSTEMKLGNHSTMSSRSYGETERQTASNVLA